MDKLRWKSRSAHVTNPGECACVRAQARSPKGVATAVAATVKVQLSKREPTMTCAQRRGVKLDTPASDQRVYIETSTKVKEVKGCSRKNAPWHKHVMTSRLP